MSIKKIVIKEVLILVVSLVFSLFCFCMIMGGDSPSLANRMGMWYQPYLKMWVVLLFNYPLYLLIRFIIWAVRARRERK